MTDRQQDIERLAEGMGWHKEERIIRDFFTGAEMVKDTWCEDNGIPHWSWNPWSSWHDAGMVLEKLVADGHQVHLYHSPGFTAWLCCFPQDNDDEVEADTGPAAIAEAAMKVWDG